MVGGQLSLRTINLTENQGQVGRAHLSLGKIILTVEPGKGGEGSFVSRKNDSNCRTRERWGGSFVSGSSVSRNYDSNCRTMEKKGVGSFVSGTMILQGEGGEGSFVNRNNDCNCRTMESG